MDDYFFIGMGIVFALLVTVIFIMVRNRIRGRDELEGLLPSSPKVKKIEDKDEKRVEDGE
ncbi:hypothetical protein ACCC92_02910 [Mucilaginibacter sp. Mucisp84]|uniref:hypothetical protein n=1 Tax=Mucilaginibacter sp. Mucisp84 TaxID=3243058 RepID=UPI0039A61924